MFYSTSNLDRADENLFLMLMNVNVWYREYVEKKNSFIMIIVVVRVLLLKF